MKRKKKIIIIVLCVSILLLATGYALLSTQLNINGSTSITSTWKVEFSAIRTTSQKGGATNKVNPTYTATTASFQVDLVQPGDEITYEIDVTNYGDIKAEIKGASYDITGSEAIYVEFEGIRKGTTIGSCEGLTTCPKVTATIRVGYDESVTKDPSSKTKNIKITLNVGQYISSSPTPDGELIPELKTSLVRKILNDNTAQSDSSIDFTKESSDTNGKGLYYTSTNTEGNKKTYYFRGAVTNNYVSFAGQTWRIVRINEDGSVRLIRNTTIGSYAFNTNYSDNAYVGYMYGAAETTFMYGDIDDNGVIDSLDLALVRKFAAGTQTPTKNQWVRSDANLDGVINDADVQIVLDYSTGLTGELGGGVGTEEQHYEATHRNIFDSTIKTKVDEWYQSNLANYARYLTDTGFCNDRSKTSGLGYYNNSTSYEGKTRNSAVSKPLQFKCSNEKRDLFTVDNVKGNQALTYPIGLLTLDEARYAGGINEGTRSYYLGKSIFWTMTPSGFGYSTNGSSVLTAKNFVASGSAGDIYEKNIQETAAVRPVINVRGNIEVSSGTGTSSSPYVLKTS